MATVALTGASGLLGSNLLLALVDDGHLVRATFRSEDSIAHLRAALDRRGKGAAVQWVQGDLSAIDALVRAFTAADGAGVDAVFHVAAKVSILRDVTPELVRANVDGTRHVLAAVRAAKARRLVHTSSTVCIGLAPAEGPDADETTPWNLREAGVADGYAITKKDSEDLALAASTGEGGIDVVVVNPGYMFGPHDTKPSSGRLILDVARGRVPGTTPGSNSFVDVRDVARGMIAAWHRGRRGERYILAGHNLRYDEILALIARRAGRSPPRWPVPRLVARAFGRLGDLQGRLGGREPLLTSAAVAWSFCDRFRLSSAKAERELGYAISPLEPAVDAALADFRARGLLR